jgi:hypothetical protein
LAVNDPRGGVLPDAEEQILARYCYLLSVYEVCYRNPMAANPLHSVSDHASVPTLLGVIPSQSTIDDICALIDGFVGTQSPLLDRPIVANPKFAESIRLGGADADLVVDHCLIDIKTVRATRLDRPTAYQVLGYALADSDDVYGISEVAIYLARQPALLRWSLDDLIDEASNGATDLAALRKGFSHQLNLMHRQSRPAQSERQCPELAHTTSRAAFPRVKCWCCGKLEDDTFVGTVSHAICSSCSSARAEGAALWESHVSQAIAALPISALESAGAWNGWVAELWQKGAVPEPRHWSVLAKLAGVSWETVGCEVHDQHNAKKDQARNEREMASWKREREVQTADAQRRAEVAWGADLGASTVDWDWWWGTLYPAISVDNMRSLSRTVIAHKLGISLGTAGRWKGGRAVPHPRYWPDLARLTGVTDTKLDTSG